MKKIFPSKSSNTGSINQLKCDGELITQKESIANHFCKYFSEIKLRISNQFKRSPIIKFTADKFHLAQVTNGFIYKQLQTSIKGIKSNRT